MKQQNTSKKGVKREPASQKAGNRRQKSDSTTPAKKQPKPVKSEPLPTINNKQYQLTFI